MKPSEIKRKYCPSCKDNFYNENNPFRIKECWYLKDAKIIWGKVAGAWQRPPYDKLPTVKKPDCWRQRGFIFIKKEKT